MHIIWDYIYALYIVTYVAFYDKMLSEVINMATTESEKKAVAKYQAKLDAIKIWAPKGMREIYKAHAEAKGKSLNALIIELLDKDMENK